MNYPFLQPLGMSLHGGQPCDRYYRAANPPDASLTTLCFLLDASFLVNYALLCHYIPGLASIHGPSILETRPFGPPALGKCFVGLL